MSSAQAWRVAVPAGGVLVLAVFAVLYREFPAGYDAILVAWGLAPYRFPFLDTHAVLSALDCARQGLDAYHHNPCDALTRAFNYSPLILEATVLPVTRAWNDAIGIVLALLFFGCVASLPAPRAPREWWIMVLALLSTMTAFAIERGNIDLLIFALLTAAGYALRGRFAMRTVAYALIVAAALLKFYPLVAMATALRETPRRFIAIAAATLAVAILFVSYYRHDLAVVLSLVPFGSYFTDLFGAKNLPFGLAELLGPLPVSPRVLLSGAAVVLALLLLNGARTALATARHAEAVARLPEATRLFMAIGCLLIVGCFFAGQSIGYRGIHFLFLLPALLALGRVPGAPPLFFRTAALIVFLMWGEAFREALAHHLDLTGISVAAQSVKAAFWLVRELVWWRVIGTLAGLLLCFAMTAETPRRLLGARLVARGVP